MPIMHQNTFGGRARSDPLRELKRSPRCPSRNRGVILLRGGTFQLTGLRTHNVTEIQGPTGTQSSQQFLHSFNGKQT